MWQGQMQLPTQSSSTTHTSIRVYEFVQKIEVRVVCWCTIECTLV